MGEFAGNFRHWPNYPLKLDDLPAHPEDPADLFRFEERNEDVLFDLEYSVFNCFHEWQIAIDDEIQNAVENIVGTVREELRRLLELFA